MTIFCYAFHIKRRLSLLLNKFLDNKMFNVLIS